MPFSEYACLEFAPRHVHCLRVVNAMKVLAGPIGMLFGRMRGNLRILLSAFTFPGEPPVGMGMALCFVCMRPGLLR